MAGDPRSWLVVEQGWKVVAADGSEIGSVDEVVGDTTNDIFNGITVSTGFLARPVYVPAERVGEITEGCVRLDLGPDEVERLEPYDEPPPSAQIRPG